MHAPRLDIHIAVDPARSHSFKGEVTLHLELEGPRRRIEVHAHEIRVSNARIETAEGTQRGRLHPRPDRETVEVELPRPLPAGPARLRLRFSGRLRKDLRGLYHARADGRDYAISQLAATHARRVFPCFDEPDRKASFQLSVTTGREHTVLSNQPIRREEAVDDVRRTVHFEPTPPLSSYLVALAVGAFEPSRTVRCGATPIRVWHMPGQQGLTSFALEAARESLTRLEHYFALPHPYPKLDLIAVPDFEFGAMENAGAVFFRPTLLLLDRKRASLADRKRAAEVICHELAHMWFGNLVTMAWWDDLWLNESFATWIAFHTVDRWKPEWKLWRDFQHGRAAALEVDALRDTHPIYTEVATPEQATENFDLITYQKGASVVRMLERWLGPTRFRAGVRRYLRRHRESNAVAADLWQALHEASGDAVEPLVRAWIEQAGHPLLRVSRKSGARKETLQLRQRVFRASPPGKAQTKRGGPTWPIPWVGRVGGPGGRSRRERALVGRRGAELALPKGTRFVYGNADEGGFFRVAHDRAELERLAAARHALSAEERMGLLGHVWAGVRSGDTPLADFLGLAFAFGDDTDPGVLATLRGSLGFVAGRVAQSLPPARRGELAARIRTTFRPALGDRPFACARGEDEDTRSARAERIRLLGDSAEDEALLDEALERCWQWLERPTGLDPNLVGTTLALATARGDTDLFEALERSRHGAATPQTRRLLLLASAGFRQPGLIDRSLRLALDPEVPSGDVAGLLVQAFENPAARGPAWDFLRQHFDRVSTRMGAMLVTRVIAATPRLGTRDARREVARFFREHPVPTGRRALRQALERFDRDLTAARRAAPELARWLADLETR